MDLLSDPSGCTRVESSSGTGKMWKDWLSQCLSVLYTLHVLYKIWTLLLVFLLGHATPLHQIILHALLAGCSMAQVFWHYHLFVKYVGDFATFVRITLTGNLNGGRKRKRVGNSDCTADSILFCQQVPLSPCQVVRQLQVKMGSVCGSGRYRI